VRVAAGPVYYFDNQFVAADEVMPRLFALHQQNPNIKVSISAEPMAMHGDVIDVLDKVRNAGISKVGYQIRTTASTQSVGPH
jgi:biopolymer transport protein ExbD